LTYVRPLLEEGEIVFLKDYNKAVRVRIKVPLPLLDITIEKTIDAGATLSDQEIKDIRMDDGIIAQLHIFTTTPNVRIKIKPKAVKNYVQSGKEKIFYITDWHWNNFDKTWLLTTHWQVEDEEFYIDIENVGTESISTVILKVFGWKYVVDEVELDKVDLSKVKWIGNETWKTIKIVSGSE